MKTKHLTTPDHGRIIVTLLPDVLTIRFDVRDVAFGIVFDDPAKLAARWVELTDDAIATYVQTAMDELYGTDDRVLH
jgi:hypothetical protein